MDRPSPAKELLFPFFNCIVHKQGHSQAGPIIEDACKKTVTGPDFGKLCQRYNEELDYSEMCGCWCIKEVDEERCPAVK